MRTLFILILIQVAFSATVSAQDAPPPQKWEVLKSGMAENQVKQLVGEPIRFESFTTVKYQSYDTSVYWRYPNNVVIIFTNHLLDRIEQDRDALLRHIQQHAFKKEKEGLVIVNNGKK